MFGLDKALEGKTRVQARERVGKWRDGVTMLSHHINAQMDFCKELRGHETLKKMLEEDPEEQNVKVRHAVVAGAAVVASVCTPALTQHRRCRIAS